MIGDSTHDLDSGRAAGMTTIAVLTGLASRADLAPHADVVLDDIAALPPGSDLTVGSRISDRPPPPPPATALAAPTPHGASLGPHRAAEDPAVLARWKAATAAGEAPPAPGR